jgi:PEP-CTERM motif
MKKLLLLPVLLLSVSFPAGPARAQIYVFTDQDAIDEYDLNGSPLSSATMSDIPRPLSANYVAVSGNDVFAVGDVMGNQPGIVGEYGLNGSTINAALITGIPGTARHIAISGSDLYVAEDMGSGTVIAEYGTDGSLLNHSLITAAGEPDDLIASGSDLFLAEGNGTIGEYGLDGSTANASLLSGFEYPSAIAISGGDIYVADFDTDTVGEYGLDGHTINASLITGLDNPVNLQISNGDIFVSNYGSETVGEYALDGSKINASLIQVSRGKPFDLYIVPEPSALAIAGLGGLLVLSLRRKLTF